MPGIADALATPPNSGGVAPLIPRHLAAMPDDLRALAEQLLAGPHSDRAVAQAFTDDGYESSPGAVRNYRAKHRIQRYAPEPNR